MIPLIYVFKFDENKIQKAIEPFNCSIQSLNNQIESIYILNASKQDISTELFFDDKIHYIHKPCKENYFNKSVLINYLVKNYIKTNYFFHSDIDLVWQFDTMNKINNYLKYYNYKLKNLPLRIVPYNTNMNQEFYSSDYNILEKMIDKKIQHPQGFSHGNGLIHTQSFLDIHGYDEDYKNYSPEDQDLNMRLQIINEVIYDKNIKEVHLWHELNTREYLNENDNLFRKSQELVQQGNIIRNIKEFPLDGFGEY